MILFTRLIPRGYSGMTIYPFILLKPAFKSFAPEVRQRIVRHEKIHIAQQREMLVLPFFLVYCIDYFVKLIQYREHHKAYCRIIFEQEAYANDADPDYLVKRRTFAAFFSENRKS